MIAPDDEPEVPWQIGVISSAHPLFPQVVKLGDKNKPLVGLMPKGAFEEHADKGRILGAHSNDGQLAGYLLFRTLRSETVVIAHLCVHPSFQGKGVARALLDRLRKETPQCYGIRLRCRKDFPASRMWPKLGFKSVREILGRNKFGKPLVEWWFDYGRPLLFDRPKASPPASSTIRVVLDANTCFDLHSERPQGAATRALLEDWIGALAEIQWLVTPELSKERRRGKSRTTIQYPELTTNPEHFDQSLIRVVQTLYGNVTPESLRARDLSDARQIAHAVAAGETCYLTRDEGVLARSSQLREKFNLEVLNPLSLLTRLDRIRDAQKYAPIFLQDRNLKFAPLDPKDVDEVAHLMLLPGERKAALRQCIAELLANLTNSELRVVLEGGKPIALLGLQRDEKVVIRIRLLRVINRLSGRETLMRHLLWQAVEQAVDGGVPLVQFRDTSMPDDALLDCDFVPAETGWWRRQLAGEFTCESLAIALRSTSSEVGARELGNQLADRVDQVTTAEEASTIERLIWPGTVLGRGISTFLVPIRPHWAKELFDHKLAEDYVFSPTSNLILNTENVYYSAAIPPSALKAGSRILWYVSAAVHALRAVSICDEVAIDDPKSLFKRFRNLGIYEWTQIRQMVEKKEKEGGLVRKPPKLMAIRFSHTRLLKSPVSYPVMTAEYHKTTGKRLPVQFPVQIDEKVFLRWLALGAQ